MLPANISPLTEVSAAALLTALKHETRFEVQGEPSGNLTLGRGMLDGRALRMALVENRVASGSLSVIECGKLAQLFRIAAVERAPLVLFLDSAGARVSEGLPALGAFRAMFAAATSAVLAGAPMAVALGNHCYGGASMLAHLARIRIFSSNTQLAMSGPSILAQAAGTNALDDMFRAIAQATIGADSRCKISRENLPGQDQAAWMAALQHLVSDPLAPAEFLRQRHETLGARLGKHKESLPATGESVQRRDLGKLFPEGYNLVDRAGVVEGEAQKEGCSIALFGFIGAKPLGAARAWHLADRVWAGAMQRATQGAESCMLLLDCESHATNLDDEKIVLSEYLAHLALSFALVSQTLGKDRLSTTVLGKAGGGVYVAFAAPADRVALLHGAEIQVLPGNAIASILGESSILQPRFDDYVKAGVAEEELRIGLVPAPLSPK